MVATSEYTNTSRVIHMGPCIVKSVHVAEKGTKGNCQVYDGESANDDLKAHIEVLKGYNYTWRPGDGTDFDKGIYIAVNDENTKVTVTYIPESRKNFI